MTNPAPEATTSYVSLEDIHVPDGNPRRRFDERALHELADSIGKHGMLQPLVRAAPAVVGPPVFGRVAAASLTD
jgi:hypothetical protein